jgi:hypothetical protein
LTVLDNLSPKINERIKFGTIYNGCISVKN